MQICSTQKDVNCATAAMPKSVDELVRTQHVNAAGFVETGAFLQYSGKCLRPFARYVGVMSSSQRNIGYTSCSWYLQYRQWQLVSVEIELYIL